MAENGKETLIRLENNVSKTYRVGQVDVQALWEVNLTVRRGEFIVVLGPSGSGKTTLLNLIGGLDSPTAGRVVVDGEDIGRLDGRALTEYRRRSVGFVFQFFNLIPTLTALENVAFSAELVGGGRDPAEVLASVGLAERADHFPAQLSGGEQQRVAVARALAKNPPLLLCDEPTGELDSDTGVHILSLLRDLARREEVTVVLVTHNVVIAGIADRMIRLRSGRVSEIVPNASPADPATLIW